MDIWGGLATWCRGCEIMRELKAFKYILAWPLKPDIWIKSKPFQQDFRAEYHAKVSESLPNKLGKMLLSWQYASNFWMRETVSGCIVLDESMELDLRHWPSPWELSAPTAFVFLLSSNTFAWHGATSSLCLQEPTIPQSAWLCIQATLLFFLFLRHRCLIRAFTLALSTAWNPFPRSLRGWVLLDTENSAQMSLPQLGLPWLPNLD